MEREMLFSNLLPVLDLHGADAAESVRALHFVACIEAPALILSGEPVNLDRPTVVCEVPRVSAPAQREQWRAALGAGTATLNGSLDRIVRQFDFDAAFLRRLQFVVTFPLLDANQRQSIWQRAFAAATPVEGLRPDKLARLSVTGCTIRNIALNAAFSAAAEKQPVRMSHLLAAAKSEAAKSDRPVNASEVADWT